MTGDDSCKKATTYKERLSALQIPADKVSTIPTLELLNSCLNYPYLLNFLVYSDISYGIETVISEYNGFEELFKRKDLADAVIEKLKEFPQEAAEIVNKSSNIDKGLFSFRYCFLEHLIVRDDFVKKLSKEQEQDLVSYINANISLMKNSNGLYGGIHLKSNYSNNSLDGGLLIQDYSFGKDYDATITAPYGTQLPAGGAYRMAENEEFSEEELTAVYSYLYTIIQANNINPDSVGVATRTYNCHGYAWYMCEGHLNDPIIIPEIYGNNNVGNIFDVDQSYEECNFAEAEVIVYYNNYGYPEHSARKETDGIYSKWGLGCLYRHSLTDVVYSTGDIRYYKHSVPVLLGPYNYCLTANYRVAKLPPGASVTWRVYGASYILSGQGTATATLGKSYNGRGDVYADVVVNGVVQRTLSITNIVVGPPSLALNAYPVDAYGVMGHWTANNGANTFVVESEVATYYSKYEAYLYRINGSTQTQLWHGTNLYNGFVIPYSMSPGWYKLRIRGYGECGYSDWWEIEVQTVVDTYSSAFMLNYDPSAEVVTIKLKSDENDSYTQHDTKSFSNDGASGFLVQLWSDSKLINSFTMQQEEIQFSMAGLRRGLYFVRLIKEGMTYTEKFVK
ncbi:MAG: hypothetical protein IJ159_03960 [Prevotella sp.]|nr:hypothetical protein [Prevotella sp.]